MTFDVGEGDERAERDPIAVVDDLVGESAVFEIDERVRCLDADLDAGQQVGPAGIGEVRFVQSGTRVGNAVRAVIVEGVHGRSRAASASRMRRRVIGSWRMRSPVASWTALAIAGATAIIGSSPRPLAPSGLAAKSGKSTS